MVCRLRSVTPAPATLDPRLGERRDGDGIVFELLVFGWPFMPPLLEMQPGEAETRHLEIHRCIFGFVLEGVAYLGTVPSLREQYEGYAMWGRQKVPFHVSRLITPIHGSSCISESCLSSFSVGGLQAIGPHPPHPPKPDALGLAADSM